MARAARVCPEPGCPALTRGGRCSDHARPNAHARGYDSMHRREREAWVPIVAGGHVHCWRCTQLINPNEPWDLGHDDYDRSITRGPEHANRCNRAAAGRASHER